MSATGHLRSDWLTGRLRDRVENMRVAGAAAQVAAQSLGDLVAGGLRVARAQMDRGHDHARRAVPALQPVTVPEPLLDRMQLAVGDAFDRRHGGAVSLYREHRAGFDGLAVDEHGACAADAGFAPDVRAGEATMVAQ